MLLTDFHIHSTYSDGKYTVPQIIDLYGSAGFDAIAITDHIAESKTLIGKAAIKLGLSLTADNFPRYLETIEVEKERALQQYNMVVITGFELSINRIRPYKSCHLVALGMKEFLGADQDVVDLAIAVRERAGVVIAAHPFFTDRIEPQTLGLWLRHRELKPYIDAWEVGNGAYFYKQISRSGLPVIANSDFHAMHQFSSWKTLVDARKNERDILQAICKQNLQVVFYEPEINAAAIDTINTIDAIDAIGINNELLEITNN